MKARLFCWSKRSSLSLFHHAYFSFYCCWNVFYCSHYVGSSCFIPSRIESEFRNQWKKLRLAYITSCRLQFNNLHWIKDSCTCENCYQIFCSCAGLSHTLACWQVDCRGQLNFQSALFPNVNSQYDKIWYSQENNINYMYTGHPITQQINIEKHVL